MIPNRSPEVSRLVDFLKEQPVGAKITHESLSELIHMDARNGGRSKVQSALRILKNQHGHIWAAERGTGIYRANNSEIVQKSQQHVRKAYRQAKRADGLVGFANFKALSDAERKAYLAVKSTAGTLATIASKAGQSRIEKAMPVNNDAVMPDVRTIMEMFK